MSDEYLMDDGYNLPKEGLESLAAYSYPKTIILLITTHGNVIKNKDGQLNTFTVPEGIKLIRASSAVLGECNIISSWDNVGYIKAINAYKKDLTSVREQTQLNAAQAVLDGIANNDMSKDAYGVQKKKADELSRKRKAGEDYNEDNYNTYTGYVSALERGLSHSLNVFNSGERSVNKVFSRSNSQAESIDWILKVVNMPGQPDLMSFLKRQLIDVPDPEKPNEEQDEAEIYVDFKPENPYKKQYNKSKPRNSEISTEEIVAFLKSKGVETVIMFDVSCSNIIEHDSRDDVSRRENRRYMRELRTERLGGRKSRLLKSRKKRVKSRTKRKSRKRHRTN